MVNHHLLVDYRGQGMAAPGQRLEQFFPRIDNELRTSRFFQRQSGILRLPGEPLGIRARPDVLNRVSFETVSRPCVDINEDLDWSLLCLYAVGQLPIVIALRSQYLLKRVDIGPNPPFQSGQGVRRTIIEGD